MILSTLRAKPGEVRVLLVDDCPAMRLAVTTLLRQDNRIVIVGVAEDGLHALDLAARLLPDVIVTDLEMPRMHGAEFVVQQMSRRALPIIVFSALNRDHTLAELAMSGGAVDFLSKPVNSEEVNRQQQRLRAMILANALPWDQGVVVESR